MQRYVRQTGFRLGIRPANVGMVAGGPTLDEPSMAGKVRCAVIAAAPANAIEILSGLVDRVGRPREGDVSAQ
jgi:hypothetical protein